MAPDTPDTPRAPHTPHTPRTNSGPPPQPPRAPLVTVRRAAALPAVAGDPGAALAPRGVAAPVAETVVIAPAEAPPLKAEPMPEPRTAEPGAETLAESAGPPADLAGVEAGAEAEGAGNDESLSAGPGPRKPMLAAAGMVGAVLLALPFLVMALGDDGKAKHPVAAAGNAATAPAAGHPDGPAGAYASASPSASSSSSRSPSPSPSASASPRATTKKKPAAGGPTQAAVHAAPTAATPKATNSQSTSGTSTGSTTTTGTVNTVNLALGRPVDVDTHTQDYVGSNITDGNAGTYWESANGTDAFPHAISVDLGSEKKVSRVVLKLPPVADWNVRTQNITVYGAHNTTSAFGLVSAADYTFNAATGNTVTIRFTATATRYVQLWFTANSGWPAAQLSELAAY